MKFVQNDNENSFATHIDVHVSRLERNTDVKIDISPTRK